MSSKCQNARDQKWNRALLVFPVFTIVLTIVSFGLQEFLLSTDTTSVGQAEGALDKLQTNVLKFDKSDSPQTQLILGYARNTQKINKYTFEGTKYVLHSLNILCLGIVAVNLISLYAIYILRSPPNRTVVSNNLASRT
jgi:predicted PurR-regulated permease PerM